MPEKSTTTYYFLIGSKFERKISKIIYTHHGKARKVTSKIKFFKTATDTQFFNPLVCTDQILAKNIDPRYMSEK